jgi:hypothetical protein
MNTKPTSLKTIIAICLMGLAILTMVACSSAGAKPIENNGKITICHATGQTDHPYEQLTITFEQLAAHSKDKNDLIPAPMDGCPQVLTENANNGKIIICHATGSATHPYNEITISFNGLNGHGKHQGDIIPAPADGCPSTKSTPTITLTPTISMTPTVTPTPNATTIGDKDGKITICHATGNGKKGKSYVMITISINGLNGHSKHPDDIIPAPAGGCPG